MIPSISVSSNRLRKHETLPQKDQIANCGGTTLSLEARFKGSAKRFLEKFGLFISSRPSSGGIRTISGSFPKYSELNLTGSRSDYFIHGGYQHRQAPLYFNDMSHSDAWQDEVYRFAREIADRHRLASVIDIGCGSGYKLLKYFHDRPTIGVDVPDTCARLRKRYPQRQWAISDFSSPVASKTDLVIASDVIEHLSDPDALIQYIVRICPVYVVISTPDRNLLRNGTQHGPPSNPAHLREWSMAEFHEYLSQSLQIEEHFISCPQQATQCVLARPHPEKEV